MFGVGRELCGSSGPTPLPKQGHPQQGAQDRIQPCLEEYLQRRRLHSLPYNLHRGGFTGAASTRAVPEPGLARRRLSRARYRPPLPRGFRTVKAAPSPARGRRAGGRSPRFLFFPPFSMQNRQTSGCAPASPSLSVASGKTRKEKRLLRPSVPANGSAPSVPLSVRPSGGLGAKLCGGDPLGEPPRHPPCLLDWALRAVPPCPSVGLSCRGTGQGGSAGGQSRLAPSTAVP